MPYKGLTLEEERSGAEKEAAKRAENRKGWAREVVARTAPWGQDWWKREKKKGGLARPTFYKGM